MNSFHKEIVETLDIHPNTISVQETWNGKTQVSWLVNYDCFGHVPRQSRCYKTAKSAITSFRKQFFDKYNAGIIIAMYRILTESRYDTESIKRLDCLLDDKQRSQFLTELSFLHCRGASSLRNTVCVSPETLPLFNDLISSKVKKAKCPACKKKKMQFDKFGNASCKECETHMDALQRTGWILGKDIKKQIKDELKARDRNRIVLKPLQPASRRGRTNDTVWVTA